MNNETRIGSACVYTSANDWWVDYCYDVRNGKPDERIHSLHVGSWEMNEAEALAAARQLINFNGVVRTEGPMEVPPDLDEGDTLIIPDIFPED